MQVLDVALGQERSVVEGNMAQPRIVGRFNFFHLFSHLFAL